MARKRMVDPSIWTDEGMTALTPRQQLLYIGLFSNADDAGRLRGSPKAIRMTLPTIYARVKDDDIQKDLDAVLREMRRLVRYEVDARQYLEFQNYAKWQRIDRPSESALPLNRGFDDCSSNDRGALDSRLVEIRLVEEKVEEKKGGARKPRTPRAYEPVDEEFLGTVRAKYEPIFGADLCAAKINHCLTWAKQKGYKDPRSYLENWLAEDAAKLTQERTNGTARNGVTAEHEKLNSYRDGGATFNAGREKAPGAVASGTDRGPPGGNRAGSTD